MCRETVEHCGSPAAGTVIQNHSKKGSKQIAAKGWLIAINIKQRMLLAHRFLRKYLKCLKYKTPIDMVTTSEWRIRNIDSGGQLRQTSGSLNHLNTEVKPIGPSYP
jgi:hypothetical protein